MSKRQVREHIHNQPHEEKRSPEGADYHADTCERCRAVRECRTPGCRG